MRQEFQTIEQRADYRGFGNDHKDVGPLGVIGMIVGLAVIIAWAIFWLWMLIDLLKRKNMDGTTKLLWAMLIVFVNLIGVILYFFLVYRPESKKVTQAASAPSIPPTNNTQQ